VSLFGLALLVALLTGVEWAASLPATSALLFIAGGQSGAAFAWASGWWAGRPGTGAAPLYAADVAGGAAAAWGTTLCLVPLAGLDGTALAMAACAAAMVLCLPRAPTGGDGGP
jgi:hypothetical protein